MALKLFGFTIQRDDEKEIPESVVSPSLDDGAININSGAHYGIYVDLDGSYRSEVDLLSKYRTMAMQPEMENAIDDIINEAIVHDEHGKIVDIILDDLDQPDNIKKLIRDEFRNVTKLLDFDKFGPEIFRRWYVDGRAYWNVVIDPDNPRDGIQQLIFIDPRRIRKIRNITKEKNKDGVDVITKIEVFYLYNEKIVNNNIQTPQIIGNFAGGVKLSEDSIIHLTSGLFDPAKSTVLSYLHKAIRPMNQLRFIEDATVIYKVTRAPERRVFYVDVGNMPRAKAEQYLKDVMTKFRNKLVYDAGTGEIRDDRKHFCLAMDTKVPLLDGRTLTIAEIQKEYEAGNKLWAYSCDPITGKFVPGLITWAGIARKDAKVMKLTLDNGESITCTPDHRFPVWNKGMVAAQDITPGESMVPFYKKKALIDSGLKAEDKDYEMIWLNESKSWNYTHREVSKWKDQQGLDNQFTHREQYQNTVHNVIHHININRFDNSPENLVRMNARDHILWHQHSGSNSGKVGGKNCYEMRKGFHNTNHPNYIKWHSDGGKTVTPARVVAAQKNFTKGREVFQELMKDPEFSEKFRKQQKDNWTPENKEGARQRAIKNNLSKKGNDARWAKHRAEKEAAAKLLRNHKVVSVEYLDEVMDTGCLTIDNEYHTFALDVGIYSENSMLEDFWMPRRGGDSKSTEITTLPAGQGFDNMDGVLYFEKKLYKALGVPVSRLESGNGFNLGRSSEISRDEIKFDKFIQKLRNRFSILFDELLKRQLTLKGVCTLDEWAEMKQDVHYKFQTDNNFTELKEAELITNRVNTLMLVDPFVGKYFSHLWVQQNILQMDDEDIRTEKKQMDKEAKDMEAQAGPMADAAPPGPPLPTVGPDGKAQEQKPTGNIGQLNKRVSDQLV